MYVVVFPPSIKSVICLAVSLSIFHLTLLPYLQRMSLFHVHVQLFV